MVKVDNQLCANDLPETLERLIEEGYLEENAKGLIGYGVTSEIFEVLRDEGQFNPARYGAALTRLPQLPWD